jgi:hypothetical protein
MTKRQNNAHQTTAQKTKDWTKHLFISLLFLKHAWDTAVFYLKHLNVLGSLIIYLCSMTYITAIFMEMFSHSTINSLVAVVVIVARQYLLIQQYDYDQ